VSPVGNYISTVRRNRIATITISRAHKRNAITHGMLHDLARVAQQLRADEETRAVVIGAEGADFSVGADLDQSHMQGLDEASLLMQRRQIEIGREVIQALQDIPQPTVCALRGVATGAGACIASACDFRIAAADARAGYGEVRLGMNLMWNAAPLCLHLIGPARAKRMIMTGKLFDAKTLLAWGFVDEVVPVEDLEATAHRWADEYVELPPIAVQMIKKSLNYLSGPLDRSIMHMDSDQWLLAAQSADFREAAAAFFEKRTPTFTGR